MPRVKRGNKRRERRKKILGLAKGYFLTKSKLYRSAKESIERAGNFAYVGPQAQEARLPPPVDHPHQRGRARARHLLQPVHRRPEAGGRRPRPQVAGRDRRARPAGLRRARAVGQGGAPQPPREPSDLRRMPEPATALAERVAALREEFDRDRPRPRGDVRRRCRRSATASSGARRAPSPRSSSRWRTSLAEEKQDAPASS